MWLVPAAWPKCSFLGFCEALFEEVADRMYYQAHRPIKKDEQHLELCREHTWGTSFAQDPVLYYLM